MGGLAFVSAVTLGRLGLSGATVRAEPGREDWSPWQVVLATFVTKNIYRNIVYIHE